MDLNPCEEGSERGLCVSPLEIFSREVIALEQNSVVERMEEKKKDVLYNYLVFPVCTLKIMF